MQWIQSNWQVILVSFLVTFVAEIIIALFILWYKKGIKNTFEALYYLVRLYRNIGRTGIITVISKREDYAEFHRSEKTISKYILHARKNVIMTSISLTTGVNFEGITKAFKELLTQEVEITISLLNPKFNGGLESISKCFNVTVNSLRTDIEDSLKEFHKFKHDLGKKERRLFHLKVHSCLPFASAILIDVIPNDSEGLIQLETKPYKAPYGESFGIEIRGKDKALYRSFRTAWLKVVDDAEEFQPKKHLTQRNNANGRI